MIEIKENISKTKMLYLCLFVIIISISNIFGYGDGKFYIGGSLDAFNPREEMIRSYYHKDGYIFGSGYLDNGFPVGFGMHFGLNITPHISFPDISGKYFIITGYEDEELGFEEYEQVQYVLVSIGMKYRFGNYKLQPFLRIGLTYENIRYKEQYVVAYGKFIRIKRITDFYWGFAPYIGAGLSYYPIDGLSLDLGIIYTHGRGSYKEGESMTYPLGGTTITSSLTCYPF